MSGGFNNPLVSKGGSLVYPSIHSPDFVAGVSGWSIRKDGSVEFNNGVFRGTLTANEIDTSSIGNSTIVNSDFQGGTMEETAITFDTVGGRILMYNTTVVTATFNASNSFTPPAGIASIFVQGWGVGGNGDNASGTFGGIGGGGGSGGEFAADTLDVTPLVAFPFTMGPGVDTVMAGLTKTLRAHHGKNANGSTPGSAAFGSTNATHFSSGPGGNGSSSGGQGGGGGSSGGTSSGGNGGHNATPTVPGLGGTAPTGAGRGGDGKGAANGQNGFLPGGGGGGCDKAHTPGSGGSAQLIISYVSAQSLVGSVAANAGSDALGNAFPAQFMGQLFRFTDQATPAFVAGSSQLYSASGKLAQPNFNGVAQIVASARKASVAPLTVTQAVATSITAAWVIPGNEPDVGSIYKVTAYGNGTWGSTAQGLTWSAQIGGNIISVTIAAADFAISTGFNWEAELKATCIVSGVSGDWRCTMRGCLSATAAALVPGTAAVNTIPFVRSNSASMLATTLANTSITIQCQWAATTGAPTITSQVNYYQRAA